MQGVRPQTQEFSAAASDAAARDAALGDAATDDFERGVILGLSGLWVLWMAYKAITDRSDFDLRNLLMTIGLLIAGPIAIRFLFAREQNKLIMLTVIALAMAGTMAGGIKQVGLVLRWVLMGLAALIGFDAFFKRPAMIATFPHAVVLAWGMLAMASATYAIREPAFAFEKSISVFMLFGAAMLYVYDRCDSPERIASVLATLGKLTVAFFAANFIYLFSSAAYLGGRYRGITENPNTLGGFFTVTMAPMVYLAYRALQGERNRFKLQSMIYPAMALGSIYLLFRSGSRAGLLGSFVGSSIFLLFADRRLFTRLTMLLAPLVAMVLVIMPSADAPSSILLDGEADAVYRHLLTKGASGRFEAWDVALEYIHEAPLLGTGWGTTRFLYEERLRTYEFKHHYGAHAHNSYLELTMELGIPMGALFVLMLAYVALVGLRTTWRLVDSEHRVVMAALMGAYFGGLVGAIWESWMIAVGSFGAFSLWIVLAVITRASNLPPTAWQKP